MKINRGSSAACAVLGLIVAGFVVLGTAVLLAQTDTTVGTWKLNLAKSRYSPGPPPASETRTYETFAPNGIKGTFHRVDAAGKTITIGYSAKYDGKDYAYTGSPDADTLAIRLLDANTTEATLKKNGKAVITTRAVVSQDGKTRTATQTSISGSGQKVDNVLVFEKQ